MGTSTLPDGIIEGVAIGNLKSISEQPAMLSNLAYSNAVANNNLSMQNAVANQQAGNELTVAVTGKAANTVTNLGPLEARSAVDILTNDEVAQAIIDIKGAVLAMSGSGSGSRPSGAPGSRKNPLKPNVVYTVKNGPLNLSVEGVSNPDDVQVTKIATHRGTEVVITAPNT